MKKKHGPVHLSTVRRKYKDKVYECHLLRRTVREGKKVRNETVANVTHLPPDVIAILKRALSGEKLVSAEERVRAHFFLCMLAYYVEWHLRRTLAPLLFQDEDVITDRATRDPVAKPEPSRSVIAKKGRKKTPDGLPVHSFKTLLAALASQARVTYRVPNSNATFDRLTEPTSVQQRAFEVLGL